MKIVLKSKRAVMTPALKLYLRRKVIVPLEKLTGNSLLATLLEIEIERTTRHHRHGKIWRAEANLTAGKRIIRAEEFGETPEQAVDLLERNLMREVKAFKEKLIVRERRRARRVKGTLKGI